MNVDNLIKSETIKENEQALVNAIEKHNYFQAYFLCDALVGHLLELTFKEHEFREDQIIVERLRIFRKRCNKCVPKDQHLSNDFFYELDNCTHAKRELLSALRHYGYHAALQRAFAITGKYEKLYYILKEWVVKFGNLIDYEDHIIISEIEGIPIDIEQLIDFLSEIHSHTIYSPNILKERLKLCGLKVEINEYGKDSSKEGYKILYTRGDWGDPGISSSSLIGWAYRIITGETAQPRTIGRGFQYDEILNKLKTFCKNQL